MATSTCYLMTAQLLILQLLRFAFKKVAPSSGVLSVIDPFENLVPSSVCESPTTATTLQQDNGSKSIHPLLDAS